MGVGLVARHRRSAHVPRGEIFCLFHIFSLSTAINKRLASAVFGSSFWKIKFESRTPFPEKKKKLSPIFVEGFECSCDVTIDIRLKTPKQNVCCGFRSPSTSNVTRMTGVYWFTLNIRVFLLLLVNDENIITHFLSLFFSLPFLFVLVLRWWRWIPCANTLRRPREFHWRLPVWPNARSWQTRSYSGRPLNNFSAKHLKKSSWRSFKRSKDIYVPS